MVALHVVRVFVGDDGRAGNPLGVVLRGTAVPPGRRQAVAARLGFSETVFVDDVERGELRIFTPGDELAFAGHPLVGTSWLLRRHDVPVDVLRPPAGDVRTWEDGDGRVWIRGRPEWSPPFHFEHFASPSDVDALTGAPPGVGEYYAWAWLDEKRRHVRSRMFAPDLAVEEDEATGSAAVALGGLLGRPLVVVQGEGSILHVVPARDGTVAVGGTVLAVEERDLDLASVEEQP